jgi:uncharacterized protein (DUF1501 family)
MLHLEGNRGVRFCDGLTRRDFLRVGGLAVGLGLTELARLQQLGAAPASGEKACIQLFLVGGPSHLDTWDPKPDAPAEFRGPFRPVRTNVPGLDVCEHFPRLARRADRFAVLRSIYHKEAPIHETGHQLMQTGYLFRGDAEWPHFGAVLSKLRPAPASGPPPWVVLPGPLGNTGVGIGHGQTAGFLGPQYGPFVASDAESPHGLDPARLSGRTALLDAVDAMQCEVEGRPAAGPAEERALGQVFDSRAKRAFDLDAEPESVRDRYGRTTFGQACLLARRLVQHGVRLVTVNMFDTVFNRVTWDCHATGGDLHATLDDYRDTLCPMFDQAYTALLDDLEATGLLGATLVLAMGEFGRTPKVNRRNGRDHWPGVWSGLLAGGGVKGGQVVGSSDARGEEPRDRPVHPSEIAATVYHALGIDLATRLPGSDGRPVPLAEARPVLELF